MIVCDVKGGSGDKSDDAVGREDGNGENILVDVEGTAVEGCWGAGGVVQRPEPSADGIDGRRRTGVDVGVGRSLPVVDVTVDVGRGRRLLAVSTRE